MQQLTFPTLFGHTPLPDETTPYTATYTIVDSTDTNGSNNISTMDNVDNSFSGAPVTVRKDFIIPTVSLAVEEASGFAFDLTLSSADSLSGPSGFYDVEYRDGENGTWQLWKDDITETEMQFTVIPGHSLYFRVSSKDRVDNEGQSAVMGPYEAKLETIKYYYFGGQRVAMRRCDAGGACDDPLYLHGDHLGSVSLTTDSSGAVVAQARYMPYGEVRWESSALPTDYAFTGQRLEQGFGLMDYQARFYSPRLGRFISADSLVPNPGDAASFDRYMYAAGNPLRYIDPSGHGGCLPKHCGYMHDYDNGGAKIINPSDFTLENKMIYFKQTYGGITAEQFFLSQLQSPIHDPSQNNPHGMGQFRGDFYYIDTNGNGRWDQGEPRSDGPFYHPGVDLGDTPGTPIYAVYPGIVVYADWTYDFGYTIIVKHDVYGHAIYSIYGHLGSQLDQSNTGILVRDGQYVDTTTQIGTLGDTKGPRTNPPITPHLHFEVRLSTNVDLSQNNLVRGMQCWLFGKGDTSWYRICSDWRDCFVDLGVIYGYDPTYDLDN